MRAASALPPPKRRRKRPVKRALPKRRSRPRRRHASQKAPSRRSVLDAIVRAFGPKRPYDEQEAAVDALSGKEPCRHGRWPHEGGICPLCAGEVAVKVCQQLFGSAK
jgi:hypothetical protein